MATKIKVKDIDINNPVVWEVLQYVWPNQFETVTMGWWGSLQNLYFWDWSDWDVIISSNTTLTRDMYYENLTINIWIELNTNWFLVFVSWTLENNWTIINNWSDQNSLWEFWSPWSWPQNSLWDVMNGLIPNWIDWNPWSNLSWFSYSWLDWAKWWRARNETFGSYSDWWVWWTQIEWKYKDMTLQQINFFEYSFISWQRFWKYNTSPWAGSGAAWYVRTFSTGPRSATSRWWSWWASGKIIYISANIFINTWTVNSNWWNWLNWFASAMNWSASWWWWGWWWQWWLIFLFFATLENNWSISCNWWNWWNWANWLVWDTWGDGWDWWNWWSVVLWPWTLNNAWTISVNWWNWWIGWTGWAWSANWIDWVDWFILQK